MVVADISVSWENSDDESASNGWLAIHFISRLPRNRHQNPERRNHQRWTSILYPSSSSRLESSLVRFDVWRCCRDQKAKCLVVVSGPLSLQRAKKTARKDAAASPSKSYQVAKDEELPEGAVPMHLVEEKSSKKKKKGGNDEQQLASVDLTPDLLEDEVVPSPTSSGPTPTTAEVAKPKKKKKDSSSAAAGVTSPASEEPSQAATPKPKKKVKKRQVVLDDTPTTTTPAAEGTGSRDGGYEEL